MHTYAQVTLKVVSSSPIGWLMMLEADVGDMVADVEHFCQ